VSSHVQSACDEERNLHPSHKAALDLADLDAALPLEVASCGVPFLLVPVNTLQAMRSIRFRLDVWEHVLRDFEAPHVFVFTGTRLLEHEEPGFFHRSPPSAFGPF